MLADSGARLLLHDPRCAETAGEAGAGDMVERILENARSREL